MIMFTESDRARAISLHRQEWKLLAGNPLLKKDEVLDLMGYSPGHILHFCFLCQYSYDVAREKALECSGIARKDGMCEFCPLEWPGGICVFLKGGGLFNAWLASDSVKERAALAKQISELPERAEVPKPIFDGINVVELPDRFTVQATKGGNAILAGNICEIFKDGRGLRLVGFVNEFFKTDCLGGPIKIIQ
uniref:Uncharacterized protein n=2 Tax=viral metagenome TaxID=1070528 RepID=A0A6H1ZID3_9ZZZZ